MTGYRWGDKRVPVSALMDEEVEGQPWPVIVTQGNLHYLTGDGSDDYLICHPLNADGTVDTDDAGPVDFDRISPALAESCRAIAALLRAQARLEDE